MTIKEIAQQAGGMLLRMMREKQPVTAYEKIPVRLEERDSVKTIV